MFADLFWDWATWTPTLCVLGVLLVASLVVYYFPLGKWIPVIAPYVEVAHFVSIATAALLCFLIGFRVNDERQEAKNLRNQLAAKSIDLTAAQDAAVKADAARKESADKAAEAEQRIADYADELKKRPNAACTLGDGDFRGVSNNRKRTR